MLVAGSGQFYNGESGKGMAMLCTEVVSIVVIYAARADNLSFYGASVDVDNDDAIGTLAWVIFLANKYWTQHDAYNSAIRINKANGYLSQVRLTPIKRGVMMSFRF